MSLIGKFLQSLKAGAADRPAAVTESLPRIDRRRPDALKDRLVRLFTRPRYKTFFVPDGQILHILLASEAAPMFAFLSGERSLNISLGLTKGAFRTFTLYRLNASGRVSSGLDMTAIFARLTSTTDLDAVARCAVTQTGRDVNSGVREVLSAFRKMRSGVPTAAPFLGTLDKPVQDYLAARAERMLARPGWNTIFLSDGPLLTIFLVHGDAQGASTMVSETRSLIAKALVRKDYSQILVRRGRRDASLTDGVDITASLYDIERPELLDHKVAARAYRAGDTAPSSYAATLKSRQDAIQLWPALAKALPLPRPTEDESAAELVEIERRMGLYDRFLRRKGWRPLVAWRNRELLVALTADDAPLSHLLASADLLQLAERLSAGLIDKVIVRKVRPSGVVGPGATLPGGLPDMTWSPHSLAIWLTGIGADRRLGDDPKPTDDYYFDYLAALRLQPGLIDFVHASYKALREAMVPKVIDLMRPFDRPDRLPPSVPAQPKRRSVVFLHDNYYYFNNMASALKDRGWDALTVSVASPEGAHSQFTHGADLNLFDPNPELMARNLRQFVEVAPERFGVVHFYGLGVPSFFPSNFDGSAAPTLIPWDFMELRRHRMLIGNTPSGCLEGPRQSSIRAITGGLCSRCVWEHRPDVCSDDKNFAWTRKLDQICDWVGLEGDWATPERLGPTYVKRPIATGMSPQMWRPDLEPPEDMRIERAPGEIFIYHAVGNYHLRRNDAGDIKGTGAIIRAVDRLKAEGYPVKFIFATDIPSTKVRFLQVQADIVVDQLNYGRHGANAREAFMLGKPVVASVSSHQAAPLPALEYLEESPAIRAGEDDVYEVLKRLIETPQDLKRIGEASRAFALKWHASDVCALRFERVIDRLSAGLAPEADDVFA